MGISLLQGLVKFGSGMQQRADEMREKERKILERQKEVQGKLKRELMKSKWEAKYKSYQEDNELLNNLEGIDYLSSSGQYMIGKSRGMSDAAIKAHLADPKAKPLTPPVRGEAPKYTSLLKDVDTTVSDDELTTRTFGDFIMGRKPKPSSVKTTEEQMEELEMDLPSKTYQTATEEELAKFQAREIGEGEEREAPTVVEYFDEETGRKRKGMLGWSEEQQTYIVKPLGGLAATTPKEKKRISAQQRVLDKAIEHGVESLTPEEKAIYLQETGSKPKKEPSLTKTQKDIKAYQQAVESGASPEIVERLKEVAFPNPKEDTVMESIRRKVQEAGTLDVLNDAERFLITNDPFTKMMMSLKGMSTDNITNPAASKLYPINDREGKRQLLNEEQCKADPACKQLHSLN